MKPSSMNLKKLLLLVFMYMHENDKEKLESFVCEDSELTRGGLIYIAKMLGFTDIAETMCELGKVDAVIKTEEFGEGEIWERDILDEKMRCFFKDENFDENYRPEGLM